MLRELPGINNYMQQQPETKNVKALDDIPQFVFISEEETDQIQRKFDDVKTKHKDASLIFAVQKNGQKNNKNSHKLQYFGSRNMEYDYLMIQGQTQNKQQNIQTSARSHSKNQSFTQPKQLSENQIRRLSDVFQYDQAQPYIGSISTEASNGERRERILSIKKRLKEKRSSMQLVQVERSIINDSLSLGVFATNSTSLKLNLPTSENDQLRSIDQPFLEKTTKQNMSQRLLQKKKNSNLLDSTSVYSQDYFPDIRHHTAADSRNLNLIDLKPKSTDSKIQINQGLPGVNSTTIENKDSKFELILNKYSAINSAQKRYESFKETQSLQIINNDVQSFQNEAKTSTKKISQIAYTLNQQYDIKQIEIDGSVINKKRSFVDKLRNIKIILS